MPRPSGDIIILILNYFQRLGVMVDIIVHVTRCILLLLVPSRIEFQTVITVHSFRGRL